MEPGNTDSTSSLNRQALLHAWTQLSVYDLAASELKWQYIRRRRQVVLMTLTATIASVLTSIAGSEVLAVILAGIAIVLPTIASAIMMDVDRFVGTTDWVRNRYIAETIRMHIFLYRMRVAIYGEEPLWEADDKLGIQISTVIQDNRLEGDVPPPILQPKKEEDIIAAIKKANSLTEDMDDGLCEPTIENYVDWRLTLQRDWYEERIGDDFRQFKFFFRAARIFLLAGTLLGLLAGVISNANLVALIAITNTISASLTLWSDLGMVGKTYGLFMVAASQLEDLKSQWIALQNNPDYLDPDKQVGKISDFVQQVEKILEWERQEWREMVLQSQVTTEKIVLGDLKRLTERAEAAKTE